MYLNFQFVLIFIILISIKSLQTSDKTSECWTKENGICILNSNECPFSKYSVKLNDQINILCANSSHRCCIPHKTIEKQHRINNKCGRTDVQKSLQIIGGWESATKMWPWQVSLKMNKEHQCGGSIISPYWVLTAAHCFVENPFPLELWSVTAGEEYLLEFVPASDQETSIQTRRILDIINHPRFNQPQFSNDITLIRVDRPFELNKYVQTICLPQVGENFDDMICTVSGFGKTEVGEVSKKLLHINLPIVPLTECQKLLCAGTTKYTIYNSNICAGVKEGGRDACTGDSGGPLVCRKSNMDADHQWVLAGITSYGDECAKPNKAGVYTDVTYYLDWIDFITGVSFTYPNGKFSQASNYSYDEKVPKRVDKCE